MKFSFKNGQEMLDVIQSGMDLYDPISESYLFVYNEDGGICEYSIDIDEAKELQAKSEENNGEYWGAFLGIGGHIYDDPSYEYINEYAINNIEYCNDAYCGTWYSCDEVNEMESVHQECDNGIDNSYIVWKEVDK